MAQNPGQASAAAPLKDYKLLADEDIIGAEEDDEEEDDLQAADLMNDPKKAAVTAKWKKLEEDLKRIRKKEAQREEIAQLR